MQRQSGESICSKFSSSSSSSSSLSRSIYSAFSTYSSKPSTNCSHPQRKRDNNLCQLLTVQFLGTYKKCNPAFNYELKRNPRRLLTEPGLAVSNEGQDNEEGNLIVHVNDEIFNNHSININNNKPSNERYRVIELSGSGQFGQVFKAERIIKNNITNNNNNNNTNHPSSSSTSTHKHEFVAIKIIKNRDAYTKAGYSELALLNKLNTEIDPNDEYQFARLIDAFEYCHHLCLVFHYYSINLYELIRQNNFHGFQLSLIRHIAKQLLQCLICLSSCSIIHSDLKPENILLETPQSPNIRLIDFGSSSYVGASVYTYIQSRFYRSPEIILGILPYNCSIDCWSLGCILGELYSGLPLFPGQNQHNQLERIIKIIGNIPKHMIEKGKQSLKYYNHDLTTGEYKFKTIEEFCNDSNTPLYTYKVYFKGNQLHEVIHYATKKHNSLLGNNTNKSITLPSATLDSDNNNNKNNNNSSSDHSKFYVSPSDEECFLDLLEGLLQLDPAKRWTAEQAIQHPFVQKIKFNGINKQSFYDNVINKHKQQNNLLIPPPATTNETDYIAYNTTLLDNNSPYAIIQSSSAPSQFQLADILSTPNYYSNNPKNNAQFNNQSLFGSNNNSTIDALNNQFHGISFDNQQQQQMFSQSANFSSHPIAINHFNSHNNTNTNHHPPSFRSRFSNNSNANNNNPITNSNYKSNNNNNNNNNGVGSGGFTSNFRHARPLNIPPPKLKFNNHQHNSNNSNNNQQRNSVGGGAVTNNLHHSPNSATYFTNNYSHSPNSSTNSPLSSSPSSTILFSHSPIIRLTNMPAFSPSAPTNPLFNSPVFLNQVNGLLTNNNHNLNPNYSNNINFNHNNMNMSNNNGINIITNSSNTQPSSRSKYYQSNNNNRASVPQYTIRELTDVNSINSNNYIPSSQPMQIHAKKTHHHNNNNNNNNNQRNLHRHSGSNNSNNMIFNSNITSSQQK